MMQRVNEFFVALLYEIIRFEVPPLPILQYFSK